MWVTSLDPGSGFRISYNLNASLQIRVMTIREVVASYRELHPEWKETDFGQADDLVLMLLGPTLQDFHFLAQIKPGPRQKERMAFLEDAILQGIKDGVTLLDLDVVMAEAERG